MRPLGSYPFSAARHAPKLPELESGVERRRHRVAIVGGGVAGLATALALARHGIASVVLEADATVCIGSRAICISRRSLEILGNYGALEPFLAKGLPWTGGRSFYRDTEVLRFAMPHDENQRLPPMINIQQYYIEQFLLDAIAGDRLVEVRWQSRVRALSAAVDGAHLAVTTPAGDYELGADWVIGCDGARSLVRECAGLTLHGTSYEGRYVIVDIALKSARPTERLAWFDPPSNPGSTILMHRQPDDVWRIDYQLRHDEDENSAVRPENVIPRVASHIRMIGERDDWSPIWISLYRANALTLDSYRAGRLLLAGDAAHLVPIFGVRGANSAFEDAANLAWKLALVVQGRAAEPLLDSYSRERVCAALENLRQAAKSTEFMAPPSFGFELLRTAVLGLAVKHAFVRPLINPRQTQAIAYGDSPLNEPDRDAWLAGPAPGSVAPECPLTMYRAGPPRAGHLTELLGCGFVVLRFSSAGAPCEDLRRLADGADLGVPLRVVLICREPPSGGGGELAWDHTGRLFPMYDAADETLYLLRPDGHVLARWRQGTAVRVGGVLDRVLWGAMPT